MSDKELAKLLLFNDENLFNSSREELEGFENETKSTVAKRAASTKNLLDGVANSFKKNRLAQSRRELEELNKSSKSIFDSSIFGDKKKFLQSLLEKFPSYSSAFTFQNRDLETLSDEDVDIALEQLKELGVIEEYFEKNENP